MRNSRLDHEPQAGDKVWDQRRIALGQQPNGFILRVVKVDREVQSVVVEFHRNTDNKYNQHVHHEYLFDDIRTCYSGHITGYMIFA